MLHLMGLWGRAPRKFLKIRLPEIEFESDLGTTNIGDCSVLGDQELEFI